jgi:ribosomal protein L11 methyltransferase
MRESHDAVSEMLFHAGALGCEDQEHQLVAYFESQDEERLHTRLQAGLARIRAAGLPLLEAPLTMSRLPEEDWHAGWRAYFTPISIGNRVIICPPWDQSPHPSTLVKVIIEPKQAFGTGHHATTRLMLEAIVDQANTLPESALDVGTGSGILAITHTLLAPTSLVVACDIDPLAITNAVENAQLNGVHQQIHCFTGSLDALQQHITYPLIYANLQRQIILPLLPALTKRLAGGGHLLLSGILATEEAILQAAITALPLQIVRVRRFEEWVLFKVRHTSQTYPI